MESTDDQDENLLDNRITTLVFNCETKQRKSAEFNEMVEVHGISKFSHFCEIEHIFLSLLCVCVFGT